MKRALCFCLAVLILLFCSCSAKTPTEGDGASLSSGNPSPSQEPASEETEPARLDDGLPDTDLDGWAMRILSHHDPLSDESTIYAYELTGETVNDLIYNRDLALKKRFNCDFALIHGDGWGTDQTMLEASVRAGSRDYDMSFLLPFATSGALITKGLLYNMLAVQNIDYEKPWWHTNVNALYTIGNYLPFVSSDYLISSYQYANALIFNKKMADDRNAPDIYGLVRDGAWTLDAFENVISAYSLDLNGDGEFTEEDSWGFASNFGYHAITWGYAIGELGVQFIDGEAVLGFNDERFYNLAEWLYGILYGGNLTFEIGWDKDCDISWDADRVFMQAIWLADLVKFRDCESPYGIVPYPKYDEQQEGYYTYMDARSGNMAIPIDAERETVSRVGLMMEALSCANYNDIVPEYLNSIMNYKYARDPESVEMLRTIAAGRRWDIGYTFSSVEQSNIVWILDFHLKETGGSLASKVASIEKVNRKLYQKILDGYADLAGREW